MKNGKIFQHIKLLLVAAVAALFLNLALTPTPSIWAQTKKASKKNSSPKQAALPWPQNILTAAGEGAVLVIDPHAPNGPKDLFAHNAEKFYVPASILKIVTIGAALEMFGPEYHFKTDFLLTKNNDLWIVGYGDPYLVAEELVTIVKTLQKLGLKEVRDIYLDNSYFEKDLILDGNTQTRSPYDAYNLAFGVNFNTVSFRINKKGQLVKAADNIPLTPLAREVAAKTKGAGTYRLSISESPAVAELHAGQMFQAQLEAAGIPVNGKIITGQAAPEKRKVFYRHLSTKTLALMAQDLMKYSNNFMTNQIFLALGAEKFGAPASHEKAQKAMDMYFLRHSLPRIEMGDGSGLSRSTTLSARQMADILKVVEPSRVLFTSRDDGQIYYKTGTMSDIKTLAGFLERPDAPDKPLAFVILLNGPNYTSQTRENILSYLKAELLPRGKSTPSAGH